MDIISLTVIDREGISHPLEGPEGWRLMEVIRDSGLPIKAECGGSCACATCHVYVAEEWVERLIPPDREETNMLDEAFAVEDNSRLSCQILLSPEVEGLVVMLAPEGRD
jgi:2Fe-2S ferredoxin